MSLPQYLIPGVVAVFVVFLMLAFLVWYWRPSRHLRRTLKSVIPAIQSLKPGADADPVERDQVAKILGLDATLAHLWSEYTETLHEQYDHIDGVRRLVAVRATVPAEVFFNTQVLVDTPLNTEFFRHLPGLLTGVGIIGTFSGLILGLSGFEPTGNAEAIKVSLGALMDGVREAFYASAFAICAAMLITFVEKRELNRRYKQVEQLDQAIDRLYKAGAGEEYMASLVKAAEESATHTAQLKQSLVADLHQILTDLTDRQIQVQQESVQTALAQLERIALAVESGTQRQDSAVQNMVKELLETFINEMKGTFGGQMNGLGDMMNKSVAAMREMQGEFGRLVGDLRQTGQSSTEEMAKKLGEMMDQADARQKLLEEQMGAVVKALEGQRIEAAKAEQQHLGELADKTKVFVDGLSRETGKLSAEVLNTAQAMGSSIDKMNLGAQKMLEAATKFKDAGLAVTGVMQQGVSTMSELRDASTQVSSASRELAGIMANAQNAQQTIQGMVSALQNLIDQTKREAGVSKQIVDDMNKVAVTLNQVEQQTQQYLGQMTKLIDEAFTTFGDAVGRELGKSNAAFQSELTHGTDLLKAAFNELAAVIGQFHN
ncbi:MAG: anti-phage ZorAB system protein ZorA [Sulfuricellaceae bacterium]|nr:anti-phage ZorAB system protein ZorA [Sulfuricellaceae bacterium]